MKYRPEIDGLRALAVLPVMLFHAGFDAFSGGFVGVDIFFVISGYLITSIIMSELDAGKFSLLDFYERRARRIIPALVLVILACMPAAWFLLVPSDLEDFASSALSVIIFASNFFFWQQSGYFETAAELKPLLHTWSLAIEEQYYFLFPLLMMGVWGLSRRHILTMFVGVFAASLLYAQFTIQYYPSTAFYLLPTRIWELMLGVLCAYYLRVKTLQHPSVWYESISIIGLALIVYSVIYFDEFTQTPSLSTLIPTGGAALVILFASHSQWTRYFLSGKLIVGIGLISYSAYLWHQPLLAFARHRVMGEPHPLIMSSLLLIALLLAWLSWYFVETPFRRRRFCKSQRAVFLNTVASLMMVFIIAAPLVYYHGFPGRMPEYRWEPENDYAVENLWNDKALRYLGFPKHSEWTNANVTIPISDNISSNKVLIIGDSHAGHLAFYSRHLTAVLNYEVHLISQAGCPPLLGYYKIYGVERKSPPPRELACKKQVIEWQGYIEKHADEYDLVILAAKWNSLVSDHDYSFKRHGRHAIVPLTYTATREVIPRYRYLPEAIRHTYEIVNHAGANVVMLGQSPLLSWDASQCDFVASPRCAAPDFETAKQQQTKIDHLVSESRLGPEDGFFYLRPFELFCDSLNRVCKVRDEANVYYSDDNHLSRLGSVKLAEWYLKHPNNGLETLVKQFEQSL